MIRTATISKLLEVYRAVEKLTAEYLEPPPMQAIVDEGLCGSTNTVSTWYASMEELGMAKRTRGGKLYLLPLDQADPRVIEAMRGENENE